MATRIPSKTEPPEFLLDIIREGAEFTLYCAREYGNPLPQSLRRLEREYFLVLADAGGEPRDRVPELDRKHKA